MGQSSYSYLKLNFLHRFSLTKNRKRKGFLVDSCFYLVVVVELVVDSMVVELVVDSCVVLSSCSFV